MMVDQFLWAVWINLILTNTASSKTCSVCGYKADLTLEIREWECENCHTIHDRDINAAINIRDQGIMKYRRGLPEVKFVRNV
jgi:transposase